LLHGGFSVYALRGNAPNWSFGGSSAKAIELTDKNVALNFSDQRHQSFAEDAFNTYNATKNESLFTI
jgi:23S rRNA (cytosine1962-C5)-methyltransferase